MPALEVVLAVLRWGGVALALPPSVVYVRDFVGEPGPERAWKTRFLWGAIGLMSIALLLRAIQLRTVPLVSSLEALYFYAWLLLAVFLLLVGSRAHRALGALLVPLAAVLAIAASAFMEPAGEVNSIFRNRLFAFHTLSEFLGYSALSVAFCAGVLYLLLFDEISHKKVGKMFARLPSLDDLDRLGHHTVLLGFILLTLGIVSGMVWARREWGVFWVWEAKTVWTLLSWMLYLGYLLARRLAGWQGARAAWLATLGFASTIFSFLGANYLLGPGRHVF